MPSRDELMLRRGQLLLRSTQLRAQWGKQVQGLRRPLGVADEARAGVQWLLRNPVWPLAALAVVVVLRPRRVWRLAGLGLGAFSAYQRAQGLLATMRKPGR